MQIIEHTLLERKGEVLSVQLQTYNTKVGYIFSIAERGLVILLDVDEYDLPKARVFYAEAIESLLKSGDVKIIQQDSLN